MATTPGERLRKRLERKKAKRRDAQWWTAPKPEPEPPPQGPYTAPFTAPNWYEFCIRRKEEYESRGMMTAAQVYWTMRFWDHPQHDPEGLITEGGFENHSLYWEYKLESVPHMFDYDPSSSR